MIDNSNAHPKQVARKKCHGKIKLAVWCRPHHPPSADLSIENGTSNIYPLWLKRLLIIIIIMCHVRRNRLAKTWVAYSPIIAYSPIQALSLFQRIQRGVFCPLLSQLNYHLISRQPQYFRDTSFSLLAQNWWLSWSSNHLTWLIWLTPEVIGCPAQMSTKFWPFWEGTTFI